MEIITERLILRQFKVTDAKDVFEYLSKPTVNCFLDMKLNNLEEAKKEMLNRIDDEFYLAITLKENGKVIGELFGHPEATDPTQNVLDTFSPCWMLNLNYSNKGYAYEAASAYFDFLFNQKNIRRIYAFTEDYNLSSQKLCSKLGMRHEGTFLEFVSFVNNEDGTPKYENTLQYGILKKEWKNSHQ